MAPQYNTSPSELSNRITFEQQDKVADGMGGFTVIWKTAATAWAAIWPISANEIMQSDKQTMTVTHRIRVRYRSVLKPSWRIAWAGKYFNIVSVIEPNTAHVWLDILCREAA